jgi:hypothetical protein
MDYGDAAPPGFSCVDYGFPCTVPDRATPNDLFARITKITGSSITISADPLPPKYHAGLPGTYPSVPAISGMVTVCHDDTPAFQAIYHYLIGLANPGHVTIHMPAGDYNIYSADPYGAERAFNIMGLTEVVLEGDGWTTRIHQAGDRSYGIGNFIWSPCGYAGNESSHVSAQARCGGYGTRNTSYPLVDPANAAETAVRLSAVSNASNFSIDEYVSIWARVSGSYPGTLWEELNRVVAIDSAKGILYLAYPLDKMYSASLRGVYAECSVCNGAPEVTPLPHGPVATGITLRNFWYQGAEHFFNVNTTDHITLDHLYVHAVDFNEDGIATNRIITNNTVIEDSNLLNGGAGLAVGATGSRNIRVIGNDYIGRGPTIGFQSCQEGTAHVVWSGNTIKLSGTKTPPDAIVETAACLGYEFVRNKLDVVNTNRFAVFGWAAPGPWMFTATDNLIHIDHVTKSSVGVLSLIQSNTIRDTDYVRISGNRWRIDRNDLATVNRDTLVGRCRGRSVHPEDMATLTNTCE